MDAARDLEEKYRIDLETVCGRDLEKGYGTRFRKQYARLQRRGCAGSCVLIGLQKQETR